ITLHVVEIGIELYNAELRRCRRYEVNWWVELTQVDRKDENPIGILLSGFHCIEASSPPPLESPTTSSSNLMRKENTEMSALVTWGVL
ncbi:hypothetical protein HAX54_014732, partial [Datura stramonium]|nr:hypothetical protein [Datura stramonium]